MAAPPEVNVAALHRDHRRDAAAAWTRAARSDDADAAGMPARIVVVGRDAEGAVRRTELSMPLDERRHRVFHALGRELLAVGIEPVALSLASEAWMAPPDAVRPTDHPQRREALVIATRGRGDERHLSVREILRSRAGEATLRPSWTTTEQGAALVLLDAVFQGYDEARGSPFRTR